MASGLRAFFGVRERSCRFGHRDGVANGIFYTVRYAGPPYCFAAGAVLSMGMTLKPGTWPSWGIAASEPKDWDRSAGFAKLDAVATMNIADLRRHYTQGTLRREDLEANPFAQFKRWMDQACEAELLEPNAMSLATVDTEGKPFLRTVLMKGYSDAGFLFFTNYESRKAQQIGDNPKVSLLFPWLALERQVIVNGIAKKISPTESLKYFQSRPEGSQIGAWASPQSQIITSRSILELKWDEMKRKFAAGKIPLPSFWGGYCVEPETLEFWQGGANRIHDRFLYTREADANWRIDRMAP